ncbi:MAG TPA: NYN domain-containing protein [Spirochaetota bacterium]|nr:NYN domain-containing protein [Spirochaetota bacterium]HQB60146.1 NYN domain-containing protein [Spirochaetota bacterium]
MSDNNRIVKIGVFYDGQYFFKVSNYYCYSHKRRQRLDIDGLHKFIISEIKDISGIDSKDRNFRIIDAHYFRGRSLIKDITDAQLIGERKFDDVLMFGGVTTHYLPLKNIAGNIHEKGIDVWLSLEAFELSVYKKFDFVVLIACDGDYVPLIKKLNTLGTKVVLLSWDFEYMDENQEHKSTRTSQDLLEEVNYPIAMHQIIENRSNIDAINSLFLKRIEYKKNDTPDNIKESVIFCLKEGYGFIKYNTDNIFFHHSELINVEFEKLKENDNVQFKIGIDQNGKNIAKEIRKI